MHLYFVKWFFVVMKVFGCEKELLKSLVCFTYTCHKVPNSVLRAGVIKIAC